MELRVRFYGTKEDFYKQTCAPRGDWKKNLEESAECEDCTKDNCSECGLDIFCKNVYKFDTWGNGLDVRNGTTIDIYFNDGSEITFSKLGHVECRN